MNYEDVKQTQAWVSQMSKSYINALGPTVLVFKLNKKDTKLNPIYNEELNGRNYLRPFEMKALHVINQFDFIFQDGMGKENEDTKIFNFNFEDMVKKISKLKDSPLCSFTIGTPSNSSGSSFFIEKKNGYLYITEVNKLDFEKNITIEFYLKNYDTVSSIKERLISLGYDCAIVEGIDDLSECLPDFGKTNITSAKIKLSTFNREYKNASDVIEEGDLIYLADVNRLYEISSATPAGNIGWKYSLWTTKCSLTKPYVKREELKRLKYGLGIFN